MSLKKLFALSFVANNIMNQPSEDYPNFFPTVIPPPPPPGLFTIPPPPKFLTIPPPAKKPKSNTGLIAAVSILALVLAGVMGFIVYKWYKKHHQDDSKVQQDFKKNNVCKVEAVHNKSKKVRSTKNAKKSNVHERDIPVYGFDPRLAQPNGRLREARYWKEPEKNYDYEGDLESGFEIYSSSEDDDSKFYERSNKILVTYVRDNDTKSNVYKGDAYLQGETTHDRQTEVVELPKDATTSNPPERSNKLVIHANDDMAIIPYEGEGDASSEGETTHNRQSKVESDKDATGSTVVSERDLESALFESGLPKSSHTRKPKKGKGRAG